MDQMNLSPWLHLIFRIAVCMEFVGHGVFGLLTKAAWLPYFGVFGIPEDLAWRLMPLVGGVDVFLGLWVLVRPHWVILFYMTCWGLLTALLRPLAGEPVWEFFECSYNFGMPLAFLIFLQIESQRDRMSPVQLASNRIVAKLLSWSSLYHLLKVVIGSYLIGHGALGALIQKENPIDLGLFIGMLEISLGVYVLLAPGKMILIFIFIWKLCTEGLYLLSPPPGGLLEWIERGGSYGAPLALLVVKRICFLQKQSMESGNLSFEFLAPSLYKLHSDKEYL